MDIVILTIYRIRPRKSVIVYQENNSVFVWLIIVTIVIAMLIYWFKSPTTLIPRNIMWEHSNSDGNQYEYRDIFIPKKMERDDLFWVW